MVFPYKKESETNWASLTSSTHFGKSDNKEFSTTYKLAGDATVRDPAALAAYRTRWINYTRESNQAVADRFTTVASRASREAVGANFHIPSARYLRGFPRSFDVLRHKAIEKNGVNVILLLALMLPNDVYKLPFRAILSALDVHPSVDEEGEIWKYLDPADMTTCTSDAFLHIFLERPLTRERARAIERAWKHICTTHRTRTEDSTCVLRSSGLLNRTSESAFLPSSGFSPTASTQFSGTAFSKSSSIRPGSTGSNANSAASIGSIAACLDPQWHPDVRKKPVPVCSATECIRRTIGGISAVARLMGLAPFIDSARGGTNAIGNGTAVERSGSREIKPGSRGSTRPSTAALLSFPGAAPITDDDNAYTSHAARTCRDAMLHATALMELLPSDFLITKDVFVQYAMALSASFDSDEEFSRVMDACFYSGARPVITASHTRTNRLENEPPPFDRGTLRTSASDVGSALAFGKIPYNPVRRDRSPRLKSSFDVDAAATILLSPTDNEPTTKYTTATGVPEIGVSHLLVLVTHTDGRRSVQKIRRNRALGVTPVLPGTTSGAASVMKIMRENISRYQDLGDPKAEALSPQAGLNAHVLKKRIPHIESSYYEGVCPWTKESDTILRKLPNSILSTTMGLTQQQDVVSAFGAVQEQKQLSPVTPLTPQKSTHSVLQEASLAALSTSKLTSSAASSQVPSSRPLASVTKDEIIQILAEQGITDVADVAVDF